MAQASHSIVYPKKKKKRERERLKRTMIVTTKTELF